MPQHTLARSTECDWLKSIVSNNSSSGSLSVMLKPLALVMGRQCSKGGSFGSPRAHHLAIGMVQ